MWKQLEAWLARPWRTLAVVLSLALLLCLPAWRVHFGGTLFDLLPDRPVARALRHAADVAREEVDLFLVDAPDGDTLRQASHSLAEQLRAQSTVAEAIDRLPLTQDPTPRSLFETLAQRGDENTLRALEERFSPQGAEQAAQRIYTLAMAPSGRAMQEQLTKDPFDLAPLLGARLGHLGAAVKPNAQGEILAPDGLAQLVVVRAKGSSFDLVFCDRMGAETATVIRRIETQFPRVHIRWTGPHAIGPATRDLIKNDLQRSSILASILVSVIFLASMRRLRALLGVGIPLVLGTLWTSALAAVALQGLNAISIAFGAIVLGVGMDTGVHLYDRVLVERRAGYPAETAAARALKALAVPVITAAVTAAAAFGALCASELPALRQLGVLAAAGEVLTALAIVAMTPLLAALFERGTPPKSASSDRWIARTLGTLAGARWTPTIVVISVLALGLAAWLGPRPQLAESVVVVRPKALTPLTVQNEVFERFGGESGQWILVGEAPSMEAALETSEALEQRLAPLEQQGILAGFDTVAALAPSLARQQANYARIAALQPARAADLLREALARRSARVNFFEPGLSVLQAPLPAPTSVDPLRSPAASLARRFVLHRPDGSVLFLAYVRPPKGQAMEPIRARVTAALQGLAHGMQLTGYPLLEADVRAALRADGLRVGGLALGLVTVLLIAGLRKLRPVLLALAGVAVELLALGVFVGIAKIPLDAFNLLSIPVLLGITIDEIVFVLHEFDDAQGTAQERAAHAVRSMASATSATAASTAAGFLALASCKFEALRGLGLVAGVGTLLGLFCALLVVPSLVRLTSKQEASKS